MSINSAIHRQLLLCCLHVCCSLLFIYLSHRSVKKQNKTRKRHQSSRFARIKRHFSQANIDDFAPEQSPRRRPASALEKSSGLAVSEYNILQKVGRRIMM